MQNKNYSVDVLMQAIARVLGGFISFFAIFILTYLFTESQIGEYNLILSTVNIVASLGTLWLSQSVLRFYEEKNDLGAVIIMTGISVIICLAVYGIFNLFYHQAKSGWVYAYIVLLVLYNIFDAVFRRSRRLMDYVLLELLLAVGRVIPMVFLAKMTHDYNSIFISQCVVIFIFFVILIINNRVQLANTAYCVEKKMMLQYLQFGMPLMGLAVSNWFLTTSDRYIIKFFKGNSEVGIYSTNYSLANSIYMMFSLIVVNAFHPIIMKEWTRSRKETLNLVSKAIDLYLMLMIPLTFYGCLKSNVLLSLFNGKSYAEHFWIFNWTALGILFYGLSLLYHKYYELIEKTKMILMINIIAAISNIVMNFLMIPRFGFEVAAFTTFVSYILYIFIVRALTHKKFKVESNKRNVFIMIASIIVFGVADSFFLKTNNVLTFFVEGVIYVLYTAAVYQVTHVINIRTLVANFLLRKNKEK